ncbi:MAG: hypothetical protein KF749_08720 [Bacteroidetes bacterium]|nr:hypothetical protein [Bacteroidota bacterium]MCW5895911.1 hypothetical protein [Bacteroidota bacterium]
MPKPTSFSDTVPNINGDIVSLIDLASSIGWDGIRELSIYRILYLASVLFSFRNPATKNPFLDHYHFSVVPTGPYSDDVRSSVAFLEANEYVRRSSKDVFTLGDNTLPDISRLPNHETKRDWLKTILLLLGVYGESKVYEFVIRDPQYQDNIERNLVTEIDVSRTNRSISTLNSFKSSFEETLGSKANKIDSKEYLELYFDYVFSKVLKGEFKL